MDLKASDAVLDLSARNLPELARFAAGVQGLTFAQLVVIAGRLGRSRENSGKTQATAAQIGSLDAQFLASLGDLNTQIEAMFALIEAEIERRLDARSQKGS